MTHVTRRSGWTAALRSAMGAAAAAALMAATGCHTDMWVQPKLKPLQASEFFQDGQASRALPAHTVAQGQLRLDDLMYRGSVGGKMASEFPFPITKSDLVRGQERFNIYCSPCHGKLGEGNGMITRRGLSIARKPASYHTDRLRRMPVGHFYDVITNGYGVMYSYAARVDPEDRWRIAAYIRVLQVSRNARPAAQPAAPGAVEQAVPAASAAPAAGERQ